MNEVQNAYALATILDEIGRSRERASREIDVALGEIEREQVVARQELEEAQRRLGALAAIRREQERARATLDEALARRERAAVRDGLRADREALEVRAAEARAAVEAREADLEERLDDDPELLVALDAVRKFRDVEAGAASMPASYRRALREQHERARRRLEPFVAEVNAPPPPLGGPTITLGMVLAVSPPEGEPEALVAVLPVSFEVYRDWARRPEDLCTMLAYRVVAAIFRLLDEIGAPEAPVRFLEVHGGLGVQVWLGDSVVAEDFRERALDNVQRAWDEAVELAVASVEVYAAWLRPDLLADVEDE